jgi:hypothetical protein
MQITITGNTMKRVLLLLVLLVVVAVAVLGGAKLLGDDDDDRVTEYVRTSGYQAVILANDRVFFGRLRPASEGFYVLRDAHYIRQQAGEREDDPPVSAVVPLSEELHGPENEMLINEAFIMSVEDLREDSEVLAVIRSGS